MVTFCTTQKVTSRIPCRENRGSANLESAHQSTNFHNIQTNERRRIQLKKTYCELAAKHPFFETLQSCVSTKVPLSHRFKSSPAIPGNLTVFCTAGYMMMAGRFRKNHVSSGDLNRPRESRGSQPSACFCGTFCTPQKVPIRSLAGSSEVFQTSIQPTAIAASHQQN